MVVLKEDVELLLPTLDLRAVRLPTLEPRARLMPVKFTLKMSKSSYLSYQFFKNQYIRNDPLPTPQTRKMGNLKEIIQVPFNRPRKGTKTI